MEKVKKAAPDYRTSHSSENYGKRYEKTYLKGYYYYQWENIEKPILLKQLQSLKKSGACTLLDFACGTGRILKACGNVFPDSDGIDVSESMLKIARLHCKESNIKCIDITKQKINKEYDVITAFRFFLNAEPKLRDEVLSEFHSLLTSNGSLIFNIHTNNSSPLGIAYKVREIITKNKTPTESVNSINELLNKNGFYIETITHYGYLPRFGSRFNILNKYLMNVFEKVGTLGFLPKNFSQCFMIEAKRVEGKNAG